MKDIIGFWLCQFRSVGGMLELPPRGASWATATAFCNMKVTEVDKPSYFYFVAGRWWTLRRDRLKT